MGGSEGSAGRSHPRTRRGWGSQASSSLDAHADDLPVPLAGERQAVEGLAGDHRRPGRGREASRPGCLGLCDATGRAGRAHRYRGRRGSVARSRKAWRERRTLRSVTRPLGDLRGRVSLDPEAHDEAVSLGPDRQERCERLLGDQVLLGAERAPVRVRARERPNQGTVSAIKFRLHPGWCPASCVRPQAGSRSAGGVHGARH